MGVKFKPLYSCDGCGEDHEDPDKVRIFESIVKSGDESKQYIKSGMFCLSCIPLALDFENKVPETVQIIDPKQALADSEDQFEKQYQNLNENIRDFKELFFAFVRETEKDLKRLNLQFESLYDLVHKSEFKKDKEDPYEFSKRMENVDKILKAQQIEKTEATPNPILDQALEDLSKNFIEKQENLPADWPSPSELVGIEESQTTSQEPETTTENINSETEKDVFGEDYGRYLILKLIDNEVTERKFAQKNGYKDTKDLWQACGLNSLVGLYYSTTKYIDTPTNFITDLVMLNDVKVINKMFFGVPNIVKRSIFVSKEMNIALIEKENFADKIESISFEVPEKLKDVEIIIPKGEENLVPNISKDKLKSFVSDAAKALNETKPNVYKEAETGFREMKEEAVRTGKPVITSTQKKIFSKDKIGDDYI